jgi:hypothetical protein
MLWNQGSYGLITIIWSAALYVDERTMFDMENALVGIVRLM